MKRLSNISLGMLLLAACAVCVGACAPTGPDDSPYRDVAAFSWNTQVGWKMRYKVENYGTNPDTSYRNISTENSDSMYRGVQMFALNDPDVSYPLHVRFLPMSDTLITQSESFGATYALVSPLDKGSTWISAYSDAAETVPSWRATVVERFSEMIVEGRHYANVLVVKYEPISQTKKGVWIRYYAHGTGPILTIKKLPPNATTDLNDLQPVQRTVLLGTDGD